MNPKIKQIVSRMKRFLGHGLGLLLSALACFVSLFALGILWLLYSDPLATHQHKVESALQKLLTVDSVELTQPRLKWDWSRFSFGAAAAKLRVGGSQGLESAEVREPALWFSPMPLFWGQLRFHLESQSSTLKFSKPVEAPAPRRNLAWPVWFKFLAIDADLQKSTLIFGEQGRLEGAELSLQLRGFPGPVKGSVRTLLDWNQKVPQLLMRGPLEFRFSGFFQSVQNRLQSLKFEKFDLDLNEVEVRAWSFIDKKKGFGASLTGRPQILLNEDSSFQRIDFSDFEGKLGQERFQLHGELQSLQEWRIQIAASRREVSDFALPIRGVTEIPFRGLFEATADFSRSLKNGNRGAWRTFFSNFRVNAEELKSFFDSGSQGELRFSFVSEGVFEDGKLKSPRTELQLDADQAQLELGQGQFIKPAGDRLNMLLKGEVVEGDLILEKLSAQLHTFEILGEGRLDSLTQFLSGDSSLMRGKLESNLVDLVQWSSYFPLFRKIPLEGFVQVAGQVEGLVGHGDTAFESLAWRIDRLNFSKIRGSFEADAVRRLEALGREWDLQGPFRFDLLANGRGRGPQIDRATLMAQVDVEQMLVARQDVFQKRKGVPLNIDVQAELSPNRLLVRKGRLNFHELGVEFSGSLQQSERSLLQLRFQKPIQLENWRDIFISPETQTQPLGGRVDWNGGVGFDAQGSFEQTLDWRTLSLDGRLVFQDIHGSLGLFAESFSGVQGEASFSKRGLALRKFQAKLGETQFEAGVEIEPNDKLSFRVGTLWSPRPLKVRATLNVPRWRQKDFDSPSSVHGTPENVRAPEPVLPEFAWIESLKKSRWRDSEFLLLLRMGPGDAGVQSVDSRVQWDQSRLRLNPIVVQFSKGGRVSGSLEMQGTPYFERKEEPPFLATWKVVKLPVESAETLFPFLKGWSGLVSGDLTASFSGSDRRRWMETLKGRWLGSIEGGRYSGQSLFQKMIEEFFDQSVARDYLMREVSKDQCLGESFQGQVDLNLGKKWDLNRLDLVFQTGSQVSASGAPEQLRGVFRAGSRCVRGDARKCLAGPSGQAELPFFVKIQNSDWNFQLDLGPLGNRLTDCLSEAVASSARQAIQKAVPDEWRKKIQDVFKNR